MKIYDWYPVHTHDLIKSGLSPKVFPGSKEVQRKAVASKRFNDAKRVKICYGGRNAYFCVDFYKIRRENIHIIIKRLSDTNGIN